MPKDPACDWIGYIDADVIDDVIDSVKNQDDLYRIDISFNFDIFVLCFFRVWNLKNCFSYINY